MEDLYEEDPDTLMEALGDMLKENFPGKGFVLMVFSQEDELSYVSNCSMQEAQAVMQDFIGSLEASFTAPSNQKLH